MRLTVDASVWVASQFAADALYVATAREAKATLITLDEEMLQRGAAVTTVLTPANWLKRVAD